MKNKLFYHLKEKIKHIGADWDNLAPDKDTAIEYAHRHINPEPEQMIDENHYSMQYCFAHSGESVNERFRQNRSRETPSTSRCECKKAHRLTCHTCASTVTTVFTRTWCVVSCAQNLATSSQRTPS